MRVRHLKQWNSLFLATLLFAGILAHPLFHCADDGGSRTGNPTAAQWENPPGDRHDSAFHAAGLFCPVCAGLSLLFLPETTCEDAENPPTAPGRPVQISVSGAFSAALPLPRAPPLC